MLGARVRGKSQYLNSISNLGELIDEAAQRITRHWPSITSVDRREPTFTPVARAVLDHDNAGRGLGPACKVLALQCGPR